MQVLFVSPLVGSGTGAQPKLWHCSAATECHSASISHHSTAVVPTATLSRILQPVSHANQSRGKDANGQLSGRKRNSESY